MPHDLVPLNLDAHILANEAQIRQRRLELGAQLDAYRDGGMKHSMAIASAARAHILSNALADGRVQGIGVGQSVSWNGHEACEVVYGAPVRLPNGRETVFIPGTQHLRGNVVAHFDVANGKPRFDYWE